MSELGYLPASLSTCEGVTCPGVDVQAAASAPIGERFRVYYGSDDEVPEALRFADLCLGTFQPLRIGGRENALILHDRERRIVIGLSDPADADIAARELPHA